MPPSPGYSFPDSSPETEPTTECPDARSLLKATGQNHPIKGRPISRSTFAALLEALARRQGIDVERLHQAHDATILLRLQAVAEDSQNASAPSLSRASSR